jgi:hypothetical protein
MSKFAIRLLTLAITASVTVAPAMAEAAKKHQSHIRRAFALSGPGQVWLALVPSGVPSGPNCPGLARSIDCKTWPPYGEDPDRQRGGGG